MNVLLLCDYRPGGAATVIDHIEALRLHLGHRVFVLTMLGDLPAGLDLDRFDVVIVHYSLVISGDHYLSRLARYRIRSFMGLKAVFIQDEYRWINRTIEALALMKIDVLFSCVPESEMSKVYSPRKLPHLRTVQVLTGYVPAPLLARKFVPYEERSLDVGYRARRLSAWYGELAREKWLIAERFVQDASRFDLIVDLSSSENERMYGERWIRFMESCRAMLGCESGASVFDFSGEIQTKVEAAEAENPNAEYESLRARFFPGLEGLIRLNQISPRCFEAAALRTMMILYEGEYSGILKPWRHYVPLRKDHGNVSEVVDALRSRDVWQRIVDAAYAEVACNPAYGYEAFGKSVGSVLAEEHRKRDCRRASLPYSDAEASDVLGSVKHEAIALAAIREHAAHRHDWIYALVIDRLDGKARVRVERALRSAYRSCRALQARCKSLALSILWCANELNWRWSKTSVALIRRPRLQAEVEALRSLGEKVRLLASVSPRPVKIRAIPVQEGAELCFELRVVGTDSVSGATACSVQKNGIRAVVIRADVDCGLLLGIETGHEFRLDNIVAECGGESMPVIGLVRRYTEPTI